MMMDRGQAAVYRCMDNRMEDMGHGTCWDQVLVLVLVLRGVVQ